MNIKSSAIGLLIAFTLSATSRVEACTPGNYEYDQMFSDDSLITVSEIKKHQSNIHKNKVCFRTIYEINNIIFGSHSGNILVEYCIEPERNASYTPSELEDMNNEMPEFEKILGYYVGAQVLLFLTKVKPIRGESEDNFLSEYRPQRHSCWEIHQIDLGSMSTAQRAEYLEALRTEMAKEVEGR